MQIHFFNVKSILILIKNGQYSKNKLPNYKYQTRFLLLLNLEIINRQPYFLFRKEKHTFFFLEIKKNILIIKKINKKILIKY